MVLGLRSFPGEVFILLFCFTNIFYQISHVRHVKQKTLQNWNITRKFCFNFGKSNVNNLRSYHLGNFITLNMSY